MHQKLLTVLSILFLPLFTLGQSVEMLLDLNPGSASSNFSASKTSIVFNDILIFSARSAEFGIELWKYDGEETTLIKDINPGSGHSLAQGLYLLNGKVIFVADDGVHGLELWQTDGTEEGTQLIKDIFTGEEDGVYTGTTFSVLENHFHVKDNTMFFAGIQDDNNNIELWKTDGTSNGTVLVKDIDDGAFFLGSTPGFFTEHQGEIYFGTKGDGLWKTDGTTEGTILIQDEDPDSNFGFEPEDIVSMGSYLLFLKDNYSLWRSDGTKEGTIKIRDFNNLSSLNWFDRKIINLNGIALFPANDGITGSELWSSDGTLNGTKLVIDLEPGSEGYSPQFKIVYKGKMYYKGDDGQSGIELFVTDGTEEGTKILKDIDPDGGSIFVGPNIYTDGDFIYFGAGAGFENEMWVSDGTEEGTYMIDIEEGTSSSDPILFQRYRDKIFCFAAVGNFGYEPYIITVDGLSSNIKVSSENIFELFPNPTSDFLHFNFENIENVQIEILDINGNLLSSNYLKNNLIDIRNLSDGMYFVKVIDLQKFVYQTKKFIVHKP